MKIFKKVILFIFSLSMFSCNSGKYKKSDQIEQRIIFQHYFVSYDAEKKLLHATASFKENNLSGTTIQLNKKSSVNFNGIVSKGEYVKDQGFIYSWGKKNAPPTSEATFHYINHHGDLFLNKITLNKIESKNNSITLLKKTGGQIPYLGEKFSQNETLYLTLSKENEIVEVLEVANPSTDKVILSPEILSNINIGTYDAQFTRYRYSANIKSLDRGGLSETEYLSKKITIKIAN